jgi:hypothetical protein
VPGFWTCQAGIVSGSEARIPRARPRGCDRSGLAAQRISVPCRSRFGYTTEETLAFAARTLRKPTLKVEAVMRFTPRAAGGDYKRSTVLEWSLT